MTATDTRPEFGNDALGQCKCGAEEGSWHSPGNDGCRFRPVSPVGSEIHEEVVRQAQKLARTRFDEIQQYLEAYWGDQTWPFRGGDYPWLCELAKAAIEAGLLPELALPVEAEVTG